MIRMPLLFAMLVAAAAACPVSAQNASPAATTSPSVTVKEPSKQCVLARKKSDREQRSLADATDSLAKDTKGRESCSSKSMCERYDAAISAAEKRKGRHETRLARFNEDVASACKS